MEGCLHAWVDVKALLYLSCLIDIRQVEFTLEQHLLNYLHVEVSKRHLSANERWVIQIDSIVAVINTIEVRVHRSDLLSVSEAKRLFPSFKRSLDYFELVHQVYQSGQSVVLFKSRRIVRNVIKLEVIHYEVVNRS